MKTTDEDDEDDDEIATPRFYRARRTGGVRAGADRRHRRRAHGRERRVPSQRQERRSSRHDGCNQITRASRWRCDDAVVRVGEGGRTGEGHKDESRLEVDIHRTTQTSIKKSNMGLGETMYV